MKLIQVSVFLENSKGRLYEVCKLLGNNGINIRAINIADSKDFGILRMVVNDPEKAMNVLRLAKITATKTDVIAVEVDDAPGGLAKILKVLNDNDINVEYMYGFVEKASDKALMVLRIEDIDKAISELKNKGINLLSKAQIEKL